VLIECDVRLSRDGVPVLLHDSTLDRTTTGTGLASDSSSAALRRLSLRDPYGAVTEHRVPTLDEALAWAKGRAILQLDVKDVPAERVVAAVRGAGAESRVVVIVDDLDELLRYHRLAPGLVLSASHDADGRPTVSRAEAEALLASGVDRLRLVVFAGVGSYDRDAVAYLGAHGVRAIVGTFGDIDRRAERSTVAGASVYCPLIADGVDVIATDLVPVAVEAAATCPR
jgi:glycerophosphoryl diester phosphodiesterase